MVICVAIQGIYGIPCICMFTNYVLSKRTYVLLCCIHTFTFIHFQTSYLIQQFSKIFISQGKIRRNFFRTATKKRMEFLQLMSTYLLLIAWFFFIGNAYLFTSLQKNCPKHLQIPSLLILTQLSILHVHENCSNYLL